MRIKNVIIIILLIVFVVFFVYGTYFVFSPKPAVYLTRMVFEGGMEVKPANFDTIAEGVSKTTDLEYPSHAGGNHYDLYSPKEFEGDLPVILWIHGGAFVAGDKSDVQNYALQVASHGYHVVVMNYELSPENVYPSALRQVGELYHHLDAISEASNFNMDALVLAGDSAGAHLAAQFAMASKDDAYYEILDIKDHYDGSANVVGSILLCGPYDLANFDTLDQGSPVFGFFLDRISWSYLGQKDWKDDEQYSHLSVLEHVNDDFPASFISDGTVGSFTDHGKALAQRLDDLGVSVDAVFYDEASVELPHEYQFQMDNDYAVNTFNKLILYLNNVTD